MTVPLPFREPARPPRRLRPLRALHHFNRLVENGEARSRRDGRPVCTNVRLPPSEVNAR